MNKKTLETNREIIDSAHNILYLEPTMKSNNFFNSVYKLVALIPPGKVMTYGQIGRVLDSPYSAKVVGFAMSAVPAGSNLPCHRVVNRLGEMAAGPMFGGADAQRELLRAEGVAFLPNGRVNLEESRFEPDED